MMFSLAENPVNRYQGLCAFWRRSPRLLLILLLTVLLCLAMITESIAAEQDFPENSGRAEETVSIENTGR